MKFTDFGFASFTQDKLTDVKGSPVYIAPEIIEKIPYNGEKVDVFSSGVCLFAMLSGRWPFDCAHISDPLYRMLIEDKSEIFWVGVGNYVTFSESCKNLLENMLKYDPNQRISLKDIVKHDWFNELSDITTSEEVKALFSSD